MVNYGLDDTIAAISTAVGEAGIGIVRLSGRDALAVADRIFVSKDEGKPSQFKTYTVHYGWVVNTLSGASRLEGQEHRFADTEIIDEVILTVMRAPRSYTKEDVVEINCHGGIVPLRRLLGLVLENGCRLAHPGEFTKRAFLNGRIDLAQAEAVLDIIRAKTDSALKIGIEQLRGASSRQISKIRGALLGILSLIEAGIDFPEEEISPPQIRDIADRLGRLSNILKDMLDSSRRAQIFREGIRIVICGKPNVGKSSLLNAFLRQERAIVTAVAGTTRDTIEEAVDIGGIPVRVVDTAGISLPRNPIEQRAVQRSKRHIDSADLVILLFDASRRLTRQDHALINRLRKKPVIAAINKIDLRQRINRKAVLEKFKYTVDISAKKLKNIGLLEEAIARLVCGGKAGIPEAALVGNLRHLVSLKEAQKLIAAAIASIDNKLSVEFIAQDIKEALAHLDDILGKNFSEDLLDRIFSDFCIGK